MSVQENVLLVQRAYDAFSKGDIEGVLITLAENVDWFIPGSTEIIPFAGRRHGPQEVGEFFSALAATQTAERFEPLDFIADQDKVVVLGVQRWRVASTGVTYEDEWAHVFTIENGRITKFTEYHDTAAEAAAHRR
ncbi:ketosteroid isomerase [Paraburkholderia sp. CNPSo 3157]|uniref:Ketosteroid isomerase n=1 Tax=Paraburkholderia franconis TaxID=2654983 RepID=A0A7X1TLH0_9BURK|nr:nuclear transport factor 2 family protein [Paraburkholderia franconis]MPW23444.1 ketosteroid isomerase [Paraburkholderia franconis]